MKQPLKSVVKKAEKHLTVDNKDARKEIKEHNELVRELKSSSKGGKMTKHSDAKQDKKLISKMIKAAEKREDRGEKSKKGKKK